MGGELVGAEVPPHGPSYANVCPAALSLQRLEKVFPAVEHTGSNTAGHRTLPGKAAIAECITMNASSERDDFILNCLAAFLLR